MHDKFYARVHSFSEYFYPSTPPPPPPQPSPNPIDLEFKCSKKGVNRYLPSKQKLHLFENIREKSRNCENFLSEIQTFVENNLSHRCSRTVINDTTLKIHHTAPKEHILGIYLKRIVFPSPLDISKYIYLKISFF